MPYNTGTARVGHISGGHVFTMRVVPKTTVVTDNFYMGPVLYISMHRAGNFHANDALSKKFRCCGRQRGYGDFRAAYVISVGS